MNAISQAIQEAGGPAKVARGCGVSVQAVCFWRDGRRTLPAEHCITLEKMSEGRVRCEQMLPDVDWAYLRDSKPAITTQEVCPMTSTQYEATASQGVRHG